MAKLGTHNGVFHADDVFCAALLLDIYDGAEIVRTRDPEVLADCNVVFDVGGIYDPKAGLFDHHQVDAPVRPNGVKYAAFGQLWKHYGRDYVSGRLGMSLQDFGPHGVQAVVDAVDKTLVQPIDASDNGQELFESTPLYGDVRGYSISSAISAFNPGWDEDRNPDACFRMAHAFVALNVLHREIDRAISVYRAKDVVMSAIAKSHTTAGLREVIMLDQYCPWDEVVLEHAPDALYVMFPSETGDWRLQCVPKELGSFETRKPLPEQWAGCRGGDLAALTGVEDSIFCHPARFICGAQSRKGIYQLARQAIK